MTRKQRCCVFVCALTSLALATVAAAEVIRVGIEFQVNTFTTSLQDSPSVAADADGDFVVVWLSETQDGSIYGVFGRRFSSAGIALASEFQVNTFTTGEQESPSVAADANGDFVVAWVSKDQDGYGYGIFARGFSSAGSALATEFQVNTYTKSLQTAPAVAAESGGDFIVAWASSGQDGESQSVFAQRFSSAGQAVAAEFQVNSYTTDSQGIPSVAADADGDFVVAWRSSYQDGSGAGVFARRFASAGQALAAEFQVSTYTVGSQNAPAVAADLDGDFVVAWTSYEQDGAIGGVFARRFSSAGQALATEFQVNAYITYNQSQVSVGADATGDFVVAWQSFAQDGSVAGVFARRFSSGGQGFDAELQVNTHTGDGQAYPSVAVEGGGDFVVAWLSNGQDGASGGIFAQRFTAPATLDVDGNGLADPLTDGLLALRYLFGFRGATLITGAVGAGCIRCDAPSIEAYLAGLV